MSCVCSSNPKINVPTNARTKAIPVAITATVTFDSTPSTVLMKVGIVNKLTKLLEKAFTPENPIIAPPIPPEIQAAMNGFFKGNVTPYTVGSVIPNNEVTVEEIPNARSFVSFVRNATAKAAPPCAKMAGRSIGINTSNPYCSIFKNMIGTNPQCMPNITNTCHKLPMIRPATIELNP